MFVGKGFNGCFEKVDNQLLELEGVSNEIVEKIVAEKVHAMTA